MDFQAESKGRRESGESSLFSCSFVADSICSPPSGDNGDDEESRDLDRGFSESPGSRFALSFASLNYSI